MGRGQAERSGSAAELDGEEVSKMTSGAVVRGELGWWRMEPRRDLARLRFWGKLVIMEESRLVKRVYRERRRFDQGKSVDTKNWCYTAPLVILLTPKILFPSSSAPLPLLSTCPLSKSHNRTPKPAKPTPPNPNRRLHRQTLLHSCTIQTRHSLPHLTYAPYTP